MKTLTSSPNSAPGEGERGAPLPGAGLGRQLLDAGFLVVEGLRHRGVGLVAAGRRDALVFVEDARRRIERASPGGARGRAAPAATACRPRAPARGFRSRARRKPPARSAPWGRSPTRSSGPIGCPVPGLSGGGSGAGRSAAMLYQAFGMRSSGKRYLTLSLILTPPGLIFTGRGHIAHSARDDHPGNCGLAGGGPAPARNVTQPFCSPAA